MNPRNGKGQGRERGRWSPEERRRITVSIQGAFARGYGEDFKGDVATNLKVAVRITVDTYFFLSGAAQEWSSEREAEYAMETILSGTSFFGYTRGVCGVIRGVKVKGPRMRWEVYRNLSEVRRRYAKLFADLRAVRTPLRRRYAVLIELLRLQLIFAGHAF